MLKIDEQAIAAMEGQHPGITEAIRKREALTLPSCSHCGSADTAKVQGGLVGRAIYMAAASSKFKLVPNSPGGGAYFCNACTKFFD